uniref:Uncharacterized protein n=1 Tax=Calcidiscus leptoporus TaxID=127549 RepID=A0A7S0NN95_9EUKA|mmetsp:Transcript_11109/g.25712  ORF Transcript_11109/g.25712 Transcript_11109/m.25712 type:complete len:204 (+) Transcript_11109:102-713(+)
MARFLLRLLLICRTVTGLVLAGGSRSSRADVAGAGSSPVQVSRRVLAFCAPSLLATACASSTAAASDTGQIGQGLSQQSDGAAERQLMADAELLRQMLRDEKMISREVRETKRIAAADERVLKAVERSPKNVFGRLANPSRRLRERAEEEADREFEEVREDRSQLKFLQDELEEEKLRARELEVRVKRERNALESSKLRVAGR